jgi:hypothetical protein
MYSWLVVLWIKVHKLHKVEQKKNRAITKQKRVVNEAGKTIGEEGKTPPLRSLVIL